MGLDGRTKPHTIAAVNRVVEEWTKEGERVIEETLRQQVGQLGYSVLSLSMSPLSPLKGLGCRSPGHLFYK